MTGIMQRDNTVHAPLRGDEVSCSVHLPKRKKMKVKGPENSETIKTEVVCPNDTNPMGILQGGRLVQWMDIAAAVCAQNHAERICVTALIDSVAFRSSARIGDIVTIRAKVTRAFTSSMEIVVRADAKNVLSQASYMVSEAFFIFVALDDHAHITAVPQLKPKTASEKRNYVDALARKKNRRD
jgi:acyl-CoA hydrolase